MNGDNTSYYALAKSLSEFKGYVNSFGLEYTPHSHFPPGYPFMLAPFMWISTNLIFIKSISTLFYTITIVLGYLILNHFNPNNRLQNFLIVLVLATNYHLLKYSTIIMSEMALIMTNLVFIYIFILNKDNVHIRMDGLPLSPESYANVFWNTKTNAVFISVDNLPEPPAGHQYQLWAIKPGQAPIDAGIFDHNKLVQELKIIRGEVQAFAVTLEKEGGSPIASVDQTYVKGFLQSS